MNHVQQHKLKIMGISVIIAISALGFIGFSNYNSNALSLNLEEFTAALILDVDGIDGKSRNTFSLGLHDIESFTWGASTHLGSDEKYVREFISVDLGDLYVVKYIDQASPRFFEYLVSNLGIGFVKLTHYTTSGPNFEYELKNVIITSIFAGGTPAAGRPVESISFSYTKFKYTAWDYEADGSSKTVEFCWDLAANHVC